MPDGDAVVKRVQFGFLPLAAGCGVLSVLADRQAHPPAVLAPFQVIGALWMALLLTVDDNQIGLNTDVWRQDHGAIPHALAGLDAFSEIYFLALSIRHR